MKKILALLLAALLPMSLLAACGSSADSAPASSESTSAAASSEAASSAESIIGGADSETDIVVSDEANTANLDAAVAAIEAVNPIANPRALDDFSVENELMLTMDNLAGYKGDVTNDQADCGLVFVAQAKDGKVDAVKAELEAYKESLSANDLYAEFADKVALAKDARIVTNGNYVAIVIAGIANPDYAPIDTALETAYSAAAYTRALNEALGEPRENEKPRTLTLLVNQENSFKVTAAEEVAFSLSNQRLTVTVDAVPWDTFLSRLQDGNFDLYYGECRLTADWDVSALLGWEGSLNYGGWGDEETERLLSLCRTAEGDSRDAALRQLWEHLLDTAPFAPVCFKALSVLTTEGVFSGLTPTETNPFFRMGRWSVQLEK